MGDTADLQVRRSVAFRKWLWGNWGRANIITRLGIPRIVTSLLGYLLVPYAWYFFTIEYATDVDKERFRQAAHNPFFVMAYACLYLTVLVRGFLSSESRLRGQALDKSIRQSWSDPLVKIYLVGGACVMLFLLIGTLLYRSQLK